MSGLDPGVADLKWWPAPAKLNLCLHITSRRADGYHELQTVFQLIDLCDLLSFEVDPSGRITRVDDAAAAPGPLAAVPPAEDLVVRAAQALQAASGSPLGARIRVRKRRKPHPFRSHLHSQRRPGNHHRHRLSLARRRATDIKSIVARSTSTPQYTIPANRKHQQLRLEPTPLRHIVIEMVAAALCLVGHATLASACVHGRAWLYMFEGALVVRRCATVTQDSPRKCVSHTF